jgi:hypothetical protein
MARAHLDDPAGPEFSHQRIGRDRIETREPVLLEARLRRPSPSDGADRRGVKSDLVE